jgi:hypothetical protein
VQILRGAEREYPTTCAVREQGGFRLFGGYALYLCGQGEGCALGGRGALRAANLPELPRGWVSGYFSRFRA